LRNRLTIMVTIREVAKAAGVSSTTVSHVINGTRFVSEGVRARVLGAMSALGYQHNVLARSLRRGETHTLGLILPDSANPFFAKVGRSIEAAAFDLAYSVVLCNSEGNLDREQHYTEVLTGKQVDGIIFVAAGDHTKSLSVLLGRGVPFVVIDRDLPDAKVDAVLADNRQGGYLATRHLLGLGHRRIACISGPSNVTPSAERVTGYRQALAEADLPVQESLILRGDFHLESGWRAASELLRRPAPPSAVFACNDLMAIGVMRAAAELARRIPEDLAVVGFDDIELSAYAVPPLTTVVQPTSDMGRRAVQLLMDRIGDPGLPHRREIFPTTLTVRASCGGRPRAGLETTSCSRVSILS
jgi:LacI family transcriptional regulator